MEFTFSGLESAVKRICERKGKEGFVMGEEERGDLAREGMRLAFEHLASRIGWALRDLEEKAEGVKTLVVSGGVASNSFLRHMYALPLPFLPPSPNFIYIYICIDLCADENPSLRLRSFLTARGYPDLELVFPPVGLCTDNAAMIAWTGMEMWEAGWESELSVRALRKWSLDREAEDGGILGVGGWRRRREG